MVKSQYVKPHCAKDFHVKVDRNLGEIELHWSKCGCNVFMTRIYRIDDGVQRLIATLEGQETGYIDSKIAIGHTYQYMILPITSKISQVEMSEIIDY
jgi:fibronectin type 3 domain-containing protein